MKNHCFHLLLFLLLPIPFIMAQQVSDKKFDWLLHTMLDQSVPAITVEELHQQCAHVLLLDAREPAEYAVSHLPGAVLIGYEKLDLKVLHHVAKNKPIRVYCSVGYRSQKITEKLLNQGFKQTKNVYGGLFEWVNRGYPVVNAQGPTTVVHAYSPFWGHWLNHGQKVYH